MWSELTTYAGEIFWNMHKNNHSNEKVAQMIGQMANFKCGEGCFSTKYSSSYAKPKTWWQMVDDYNGYLKKLAIKLFSVIPHSVTCERTFSMLNFLYGKRRQSLNLNTIEMMSKIRYYLLMNIKQELGHLNREETEIELKDLIENCGLFDDDLDENDENGNDENYENSNEELEIPVHEVQVLIINSVVDMSHSVFTGGFQETDNNSINEEEEEGEILDDELDFEVIANISAPFNM